LKLTYDEAFSDFAFIFKLRRYNSHRASSGSLDHNLLPRADGGGRGRSDGERRQHGQGCGLVFDATQGLVITNAHVVDGNGGAPRKP
jgi:S1-C subfamily serine protease